MKGSSENDVVEIQQIRQICTRCLATKIGPFCRPLLRRPSTMCHVRSHDTRECWLKFRTCVSSLDLRHIREAMAINTYQPRRSRSHCRSYRLATHAVFDGLLECVERHRVAFESELIPAQKRGLRDLHLLHGGRILHHQFHFPSN